MNRHAFLLQLGLTAFFVNEEGDSKLVMTQDAAYRIGEIEPLLTKIVSKIVEAPGGRWVLIEQNAHRPNGDFETFGGQIWLYDVLRQKLTQIYQVEEKPDDHTMAKIYISHWFPKSAKAIISQRIYQVFPDDGKDYPYVPPTETYGLVDAERARLRWLSLPTEDFYKAEPLPGTDLFLFSGSREPGYQRLFCFLSPNGNFSPVAEAGGLGTEPIGLSRDGQNLLCEEKIKGTPPQTNWYSIRLRNAHVTALTQKPEDLVSLEELAKRNTPSLPLTLTRDHSRLVGTEGRSAATIALWLEAMRPRQDKRYARGLITTETNGETATDIVPAIDEPPPYGWPAPVLLPDLSTVLFTRDGALYRAPISRLDPRSYARLVERLAKEKTSL
ncbi:hypothetical protein [Armatimonas sp.]|uniref:hypothetical protein n=1 Tax=Armatimonas sp. TaxID=1872638 RepID=UPI003750C445